MMGDGPRDRLSGVGTSRAVGNHIFESAQDKSGRNGLAIETQAFRALDRLHAPDAACPDRRDAAFLEFVGDFRAQRVRRIQAPVVDGAGGAQKERLRLRELRIFPIEPAQRLVSFFDECRRRDVFWSGVKRGARQEESQGREIWRAMLLLGRQLRDRIDETLDQLPLELLADPSESPNHADQLGGCVVLLKDFLSFSGEQGLLPLLREASGDPTPQHIFLKLRSFAGKSQPLPANTPKLLDAAFVHGETEAGPQEETGENEPGLLMLDGNSAGVVVCRETRPKVAKQGGAPAALGAAENLLQALDETRRRELVALAEGLRKGGGDPLFRFGQRLRRDAGTGRRLGFRRG